MAINLEDLKNLKPKPFGNEYTVTGGKSGVQGLAGGSASNQMKNFWNQGGGFTDSISSIGSWGALAGDFASGIGSAIGNKYGDDFSDTQKTAQSTIRKGLAMIPGYGQLIAAATGLVDAIGTATHTNLSNIDKGSAKRAGISGAAGFNNVMNMLPGNSMIWGGIGKLSGLLGGDGGRSDNYHMYEKADEMQSGYASTVKDMRAAEDVSNKLFLFGKNKANDFISSQQRNNNILSKINETNTMRKQSDYFQDLNHQNINRYAGQNYLGVTFGKSGMKLMSVEEARKIVASRKEEKSDEVEKFQNGGIIGIDTNILPEGSLHKELHHLDEINPELEDITKKGIPVVENTDNQQVAEIEKSEIIFRIDVTKRLEELMKDGSEEAMIEAGRLITQEVIENTQDNTGQIEEELKNE